jgi:hypothetical protein
MVTDFDDMTDLFRPIRGSTRAHTLNVNAETYEIITRVAEQLGKSRPQVLSAFVSTAYQKFLREAKEAGIEFNPLAPIEDNHKRGRPRLSRVKAPAKKTNKT